MAILIDTSALLAYISAKDNNKVAIQTMKNLGGEERVVTSAVVSELFYMTVARLNYAQAIAVFTLTKTAFTIEQLITPDMTRMQEIMTKYQNVELDYTDTSIMAVAERLKITRIFTFDRRDFGMYRPSHCDHFDIIPE